MISMLMKSERNFSPDSLLNATVCFACGVCWSKCVERSVADLQVIFVSKFLRVFHI